MTSSQPDERGPIDDGPDRPSRAWTSLMVLVVAVCLVMCSFIAIFLNPLVDKLKDEPSAKVMGDSFTNPYDGPLTKNSGGWGLWLEQVTGPKVALTDLVVAIKAPSTGGSPAQVWKFTIKGTAPNGPDLTYEGPKVHWYLKASNSTSTQLRYVNGTATKALNSTSASELRPDQFNTLEGVLVIYQDTDRDGNLSFNDKLSIYRDIDADSTIELGSGTLLELQTTGGKLISSAILK